MDDKTQFQIVFSFYFMATWIFFLMLDNISKENRILFMPSLVIWIIFGIILINKAK